MGYRCSSEMFREVELGCAVKGGEARRELRAKVEKSLKKPLGGMSLRPHGAQTCCEQVEASAWSPVSSPKQTPA